MSMPCLNPSLISWPLGFGSPESATSGIPGLPWVLATAGLLALVAVAAFGWVKHLRQRSDELEAKVLDRTETLALRNKALERLHHQLRKSLEGRIQLMNTVIHDLRSPLTSILVSVDRLRDTGGGDQQSALALIERESHRLEQILTKLLDQSRAENLSESLNLRLCRPSEILQGLVDTLRVRAEAKDLSADVELDPRSDHVWILADSTALQQVVFNLIENALKFTNPPGIIGIRSRVEPDYFCLEVWDTGRGVDSSKLAAIFRPFEQGASEDATTGWGLGLSICTAMVKAHQGKIELESEIGKGATFRVIIPLVMPRKN
jgi:signal transduction histidine kinase